PPRRALPGRHLRQRPRPHRPPAVDPGGGRGGMGHEPPAANLPGGGLPPLRRAPPRGRRGADRPVSELMAVLFALAGGFAGGLVGVGGGILFVPALGLFFGLSQVEAESTSLLMIVVVAFFGARRQLAYGNVDLRDALVIGALSPVGVLIGVAISNNVSERVLQLGFAFVALFF